MHCGNHEAFLDFNGLQVFEANAWLDDIVDTRLSLQILIEGRVSGR